MRLINVYFRLSLSKKSSTFSSARRGGPFAGSTSQSFTYSSTFPNTFVGLGLQFSLLLRPLSLSMPSYGLKVSTQIDMRHHAILHSHLPRATGFATFSAADNSTFIHHSLPTWISIFPPHHLQLIMPNHQVPVFMPSLTALLVGGLQARVREA